MSQSSDPESDVNKDLNLDFRFENIKDKIVPLIKVTIEKDEAESSIQLSDDQSAIIEAWVGDLIVSYAIDFGSFFTLCQTRSMPDSMPMSDLRKLAIENLTRIKENQVSVFETEFGGYGIFCGDDLEASTLLLEWVRDYLFSLMGDSIVVAIPAKHTVFLADEDDEKAIDGMRKAADEVWRTGAGSLSSKLFLLTKSGICEFGR